MTARGTWKGFERRVAVDFGSQRIPVTGLDRHGADVRSELFSFQCKLRKLPGWLWDWLGGIVLDAKPSGRIGILILKQPHQRDVEGIVVMRYGDFVDLHGSAHETILDSNGKVRSRKPHDGKSYDDRQIAK